MTKLLLVLAAVFAAVGLLAEWHDVAQAVGEGRIGGAAFLLADALDTAAFLLFMAMPIHSLWNLLAMAIVATNGVGLIVQPGRDIGLWDHIPGQATSAGWFAISAAVALGLMALTARTDPKTKA